MSHAIQSLYSFDKSDEAFDDFGRFYLQLGQFKSKYPKFLKQLNHVVDPIQIDSIQNNDFDSLLDKIAEECDHIIQSKSEVEKERKYLFFDDFKTNIQSINYDLSLIIASFLKDSTLQNLKDVSKYWRKVACHSTCFCYESPYSIPESVASFTSLAQYQYAALMRHAPYLKNFNTNFISGWPNCRDISYSMISSLTKRLMSCKTVTLSADDDDNEMVACNHIMETICQNSPSCKSIELFKSFSTSSTIKFIIGQNSSLRKIKRDSSDWYFRPIPLEIQDASTLKIVEELPCRSILSICLQYGVQPFRQLIELDIIYFDLDVSDQAHCLFPVLEHLVISTHHQTLYCSSEEVVHPFGFHSSFNSSVLFSLHFPQVTQIKIKFMDLMGDDVSDFWSLTRQNGVARYPVLMSQLDFTLHKLPLLLTGCAHTLEHLVIANLAAFSFFCDEKHSLQFNDWLSHWHDYHPLSRFATRFVLVPTTLKSCSVSYCCPSPFLWIMDPPKHPLDIIFQVTGPATNSREHFLMTQQGPVGFAKSLSPHSSVSLIDMCVSQGIDQITSFHDTQEYVDIDTVRNYHPLMSDFFPEQSCALSLFRQLRILKLTFYPTHVEEFFAINDRFLHFQDLPCLEEIDLNLVKHSRDDATSLDNPVLSLYSSSVPCLQVIKIWGFDLCWVDGLVSSTLRVLNVRHGTCWTQVEEKKLNEIMSKEVYLELKDLPLLEEVSLVSSNVNLNNFHLSHVSIVRCDKLMTFYMENSCSGAYQQEDSIQHHFLVSSNHSLKTLEIVGTHISSWTINDNVALQILVLINVVFHQCDICTIFLPWFCETFNGESSIQRLLILNIDNVNTLLPHLTTNTDDDILRELKMDRIHKFCFKQFDNQGYMVKNNLMIHWSLLPLLEKLHTCKRIAIEGKTPKCFVKFQRLKTCIFSIDS